jgi:hypothetical protein
VGAGIGFHRSLKRPLSVGAITTPGDEVACGGADGSGGGDAGGAGASFVVLKQTKMATKQTMNNVAFKGFSDPSLSGEQLTYPQTALWVTVTLANPASGAEYGAYLAPHPLPDPVSTKEILTTLMGRL